MTRQCSVTKKLPQSGHHVSHSNRKNKRKFRPNVHKTGIYSETLKRWICLKVTPHGVKIIEAKGGLDLYLASLSPSQLTPATRRLTKEIRYRQIIATATQS